MLLSSVILILQETLEAAVLISVLLTISYQQQLRIRWLPWALFTGIILSFVYAMNMQHISEWFDYVGQEIVNASLQMGVTLFLVIYSWTLFYDRNRSPANTSAQLTKPGSFNSLCAIGAVTLSITQEGAEILFYLGGFVQHNQNLSTVLMGSSIGFGIGISSGVLLFYGLMSLPGQWGRRTSVALLALFAGNMLSQAMLQLTQADWIAATPALWNTSAWFPEHSISGRLLYALIGYEATPSLAQVISYLSGVCLVLSSLAINKKLTVSERHST